MHEIIARFKYANDAQAFMIFIMESGIDEAALKPEDYNGEEVCVIRYWVDSYYIDPEDAVKYDTEWLEESKTDYISVEIGAKR